MEDNAKYPLLNIKNKFDRVVIIGGGFNAIEHKEAIKSFIETHTNTAIIFATARYSRAYRAVAKIIAVLFLPQLDMHENILM